ncbi:hypothetical protein [Furfurilactobacillus siliginis]|uniref:hypothetical protein n=1 Tax=Furfurilactobacillus siliginis TaxID=348151 RepID=UPI0016498A64|nr:hypothetical protein [Furfurilactobacillus siliginis]
MSGIFVSRETYNYVYYPQTLDIQFIRFEAQIAFHGLAEKQAAEKLNIFISASVFEADQTKVWQRALYLSAVTEIGSESQQVILRQPLLIKDSKRATQYPLVVN